MLERVNRFYQYLHLLVIVSVCGVVLIASVQNREDHLLRWVSQENGIFEWASFFVTFTFSAYALLIYVNSRSIPVFKTQRRNFILLIAILTYVLAMEEISWGQHVFGFDTTGFFKEHNLQQENNLHNLISGEIVNLAIHTVIYVFFIFLPILVYFKPDLANLSPSIRGKITIYLPSLHNVLMFCFASGLHAYFLTETMVDTSLVILSLILIFILLLTREEYRTQWHFLHFGLVVIALFIFMTHPQVFDYYNMQYEIREFVIYYAVFYWFINWTTNLKNKIALKIG